MTIFGFLLSIPVFETFADTAVAAERYLCHRFGRLRHEGLSAVNP